MAQLKFIDLFAGIGGGRIGFELAGARCVYSSEINKYAIETYRSNFGDLVDQDITKVQAKDIPEHDILIAGFPCQPFSNAGVSKLKSLGRADGFENPDQGNLFFEIVRILEYHKPRALFLENVKNLKSHDGGNTYETIIDKLNNLGYLTDDRVLDAQSYVPQHRERIYIVGFQQEEDFDRFEWPRKGAAGKKKPRLRDILEEDVDDKYTLSDKLWAYLQEYKDRQQKRGNGFGYGMPDLDKVSRTLSARYYKDGAEILVREPGETGNPRRLTPRECARLMGFPEAFEIPVSDTQAYRQFGNSVAVPLVKQIARQILSALGEPKGDQLWEWKPNLQVGFSMEE